MGQNANNFHVQDHNAKDHNAMGLNAISQNAMDLVADKIMDGFNYITYYF